MSVAMVRLACLGFTILISQSSWASCLWLRSSEPLGLGAGRCPLGSSLRQQAPPAWGPRLGLLPCNGVLPFTSWL